MPQNINTPPHRSESDVPTRVGGPSGNPVMLMMPLIHAHDAAHRLDDGVISRIAGERPGLTEPRRGSIDQARINLREFVVREAKMLHRARPKILSDHVRFAYHIEKDSPVGIIFQIEGDALLAAVDE